MKKVLALVLAVMMMATVAFAAADVPNPGTGDVNKETGVAIPGSTISFNDSGIVKKDATLGGSANGYDLLANSPAPATANTVLPVNKDNYNAKVKWTENGNLVESYGFNATEDKFDIKLKQNYDMTSLKTLKGTITLTSKKKDASKVKYPTITVAIEYKVGYVLADYKVNVPGIVLDNDNVATPTASPDGSHTALNFHDKDNNKKFLWKVVKPTGVNESYGTLEFGTADDDTEVEVRVYDGNKLYLFNNTDANTTVLKAQADADAEIGFLNFPGAPGFDSTATVRFYKPEDSYIYGLKDGQLSKINVKWSDDEGCFILKTRTLGSYVFSDKELNVAATTTTNPDTGANDVVGIATALAAVALVSAAAVSLKK